MKSKSNTRNKKEIFQCGEYKGESKRIKSLANQAVRGKIKNVNVNFKIGSPDKREVKSSALPIRAYKVVGNKLIPQY